MNVPTYEQVMAPMLDVLNDGKQWPVRDLAQTLAQRLGLTDEQLSEMLPSGKHTTWRSRGHWATQYLTQARVIDRVSRGVFVINDRGRQLLAQHPNSVGNAELEQFEEFR